MKNHKTLLISLGVFTLILLIASDYSAYTTEMAITEYKGENFKKSFTPLWGSYIVPLIMFIVAFIPKKKKE
tara:strand:+ start:477 stop:689 length:213 start_codon:yes stop_codon:yes gene_type:complete